MSDKQALLQASGLCKSFYRAGGWGVNNVAVNAVRNVDLQVHAGETLAIVGESGCGKSTTARLLLRLLDADNGSIMLLGKDFAKMSNNELRRMRKHIQMVFQDPFASLNPRMRVEDTVAEGLRVHAAELSKSQRRDKVIEVLLQCGLTADILQRYPHQFSGGQRQRIGIARALAVAPDVMVLDEPVSALDVSVQAQVINVLRDIQQQRSVAYVFISHDLSVVNLIADRVLVMFAGMVVEEGTAQDVFYQPKHPYTQALLQARPANHPKQRQVLSSTPAENEATANSGCPYRLRCIAAQADCAETLPSKGKESHSVACLHPL
ncbi:MAG: ATP-binding cassette domain-containing protein [Mariprofundales bacterium]